MGNFADPTLFLCVEKLKDFYMQATLYNLHLTGSMLYFSSDESFFLTESKPPSAVKTEPMEPQLTPNILTMDPIRVSS